MHALWTYCHKGIGQITCIPHTLQVIGISPSTDADNNSEQIWHNFCLVSGSSTSLCLTWSQKGNVFSSSFGIMLFEVSWDAFLRGMDMCTSSKKTLGLWTNIKKIEKRKIENDKGCLIGCQLKREKETKVMKNLLQRTRVAGMNTLWKIKKQVYSHFHFAWRSTHLHTDGIGDEQYFYALGYNVQYENQSNSPLPPTGRKKELKQYPLRLHPISVTRRYQYSRCLKNSLEEYNGTRPE